MKATKANVAYQYQPNGADHCSVCTMFRAPDSCTAVQGQIAPNGWCRLFQRQKDARNDIAEKLRGKR